MDQQVNPQIPAVKVSMQAKVWMKIKPVLGWFKAHKIAGGIIIAVVLLIGYLVVKNMTKPTVSYVTEKAVKIDLKQTVSATGKVDSDSAVDLKFAVAGEVEKISAQSGDMVLKDQVIVSLKHDELNNQIKEAQAALNLQKANYAKVATGSKKEEILISMRQVENAQVNYDSSVKDLVNLKLKLLTDIESLRTQVKNLTQSLADTKVTADLNIVNTKTNLFTTINNLNIKSSNTISQVDFVLSDADLKKVYSVKDFQTLTDSRAAFDGIQKYLTASVTDYNKAFGTQSDFDIADSYGTAALAAQQVEELLRLVMTGLDASVTDAIVNEARLISFKNIIKAEQDSNSTLKVDLQSKYQAWVSAVSNKPISINTAQSTLDNAKSSLATALATNDIQLTQAQTKIDSSLSALNLAKAQLALTQSKATSSDFAIAQAQVDQAQSSLDRLNSQLSNYQITAPFDGQVGKVTVKESQSVTTADVIASIIGAEQFKISVDIPESDITKVVIGDKVEITLDAYGNDIKFTGQVKTIDPAETIISDVVYYKVEVTLEHSDQEIKKGMSANLDILTGEKKGVVVVPVRAVLENPDTTKYVRILKDGQALIAKVTTGLRGDEGKIEIIAGVLEGDEVITFEKKL